MNKLFRFRKQWGLSITDAAVQLGVSCRTIFNNEKTDGPSTTIILKIGEAEARLKMERVRELNAEIATRTTEINELTIGGSI